MHTNKSVGQISSPWGITLLVSVLASIGTHLYLLNEHLKVKYTSDPGSSLCQLSDYFNCGASISSQYSEFFGTPLALFGVLLHVILLFYILRATLFRKPEPASSVILATSLFSVAVSTIMALLSIFVIQSLCPFCTAAYVLSIVTLIAAWQLLRPGLQSWNPLILKPLATTAVVLGLSGFIIGKVIVNRYQDKDAAELISVAIEDWKNQPTKDIEVIEPIKVGPDTAKMKIVEFADFLCNHCKYAFPKLQSFLKANKDTQLLFQAFPLDGCSGPADNPGARCQLAIASYCSKLQNKGEESVEYIFNSQEVFSHTPDLEKELKLMVSHLTMNENTFMACLKDPNSLEIIKKQMEVAKKVNIQGTPTLYINGRFFQGGPEMMSLQQAYRNL